MSSLSGLVLLVQLFLGAVFLISAIPKILSPNKTARDVRNYRLLPVPVSNVTGWLLGPVELLIAVLLLGNLAPWWGSLTVGLLLVAFMVTVGTAMARKQNLSCSCFGLLYREKVGWHTLYRDAILLGMAALVFLSTPATSLLEINLTPGSINVFFLQAVFLLVALSLAWIAGRGWPQWFVRLIRRRNESGKPVAIQ